jgi:hypothetical protein
MQWAAMGAGCIVAVLFVLLRYLRWQATRWYRAEFPDTHIDAVLWKEEHAKWESTIEKKSVGGLYRVCEIAFVILGLPGMALRSSALLAKGAPAWTIVACNAIGWFGILTFILALWEFG